MYRLVTACIMHVLSINMGSSILPQIGNAEGSAKTRTECAAARLSLTRLLADPCSHGMQEPPWLPPVDGETSSLAILSSAEKNKYCNTLYTIVKSKRQEYPTTHMRDARKAVMSYNW